MSTVTKIENRGNLVWTVKEINGKWYFFDSMGVPSYPYDTKESAEDALDDYERTIYG